MNRSILIFAFIAVLLPDVLLSQEDSLSMFVLPKIKILQIENGKNVVYEFDKDRNKFQLNKSALSADTNLYKYIVNISDINKITVIQNSNLAHVFIISFTAGALVGAAISGFSLHTNSNTDFGDRLVGALIGGGLVSFIAGGIALFLSPDKEYSFKNLDEKQRKKKIFGVLNEHNLKNR